MTISVDDYSASEGTDRAREHTLADVLATAVATFGDAPAVTDGGEERTWVQWHAESRALATGLQQLGVGVGDVVAVQLPNSWEFLLTHIAVAELGAVMLPVHAAYGERDLLALLGRAGARLLVVGEQRRLSQAVFDTRVRVVVVGATGAGSFAALLHEHRGASPRPAQLDPDMPFVVLPSSGTTSGRPKLCLHSHGTLLANAAAVVRDGGARGSDILVSASPFTHLFGLLSVHLSLLTGGRQALLPRWDAAALADLVRGTGANVLFAVPAQLRDVVQRCDDPATGPLPLREVRTGGAAVPATLVADVRRLTGATTIVQWGMSELGAGTVTRAQDPPEVAANSIGRPLSGNDARIVRADGNRCGVGEVGEFQYRGPHLFRGYLGDPEGTAAAFTADGWLRTGDLAAENADGTIGYRGRDAEVINVGGVKFAASEIEELVSDLPQLAAAAVAGRPDPRLGHYPCLVAATRPGRHIDLATVRAHLLTKGVAEYKLPVELVLVPEVPVTPTGKIARGRLARLLADHPAESATAAPVWAALPGADHLRAARATVARCLTDILDDPGNIDGRSAFRELGVDSLGAVRLALALSQATGFAVPTTVAFDHSTPDALARHLVDLASGRARDQLPVPALPPADIGDPIVIVGTACRLPGGIESPEQLWQLLIERGETVGPFPDDRGWDLARLADPDPGVPGRSGTRHGHFLTGAADFDARFFGISPREAIGMDPQQRLLLETSWEALERAGIDPHTLRGSDTGVFVGQMASDYAPRLTEAPERFDGLLLTGNASAVASGRISYSLGLFGPALTVDTACSSALVALHLAAQSLRRGECAVAVVAAATVMATPASFVDFTEQGALAPDGRCKAFAAGADGAAWGEGVGALVVTRGSRALADGLPVLAVVAGSAMNSDGASNGLTAPNGIAQQSVLRAALADAGLSADLVDAVEAHGTGTPLGDRIEAEALQAVYGIHAAPEPLWVGSVKSNVGHTQAAAGLVGVLKTILALRHDVLPATLHVEPDRTPSYGSVAREIRPAADPVPWPRSNRVRRAGVSAFGIGGTNAHVILAEPPAAPATGFSVATAGVDTAADDAGQVIAATASDPVPAPDSVAVPWVLSARDPSALRRNAIRLMATAGSADRAEAGRALVHSRALFEQRAVIVARDRAELVAGLRDIAGDAASPDTVAGVARSDVRTVFVYPGQGSQWEGMGADLLRESEVFARAVDACEQALAPHTEWSTRAVLAGQSDAPSLDRVEVAQTALFTMMMGLTEVWASLGVRPDAVVGHSQGEIAAAVVCGAIPLDDAARIVARRAKAVARLTGGRMAAVALSAAELDTRLTGYRGALSLAADNGPRSTVVSGSADAVAALVAELDVAGVRTAVLPVDYASHCADVARIEELLLAELGEFTPRTALLAFYSSVLAQPIDTSELTADYWYRNLRNPVEFRRAVDRLLDAGYNDFIEISPHPVLTQSILETAEAAGLPATAVGTLRRGEGDSRRVLLSAAEAFVNGSPVDWRSRFPGRPARRIELPTYPFQRQRYWAGPSTPQQMHRQGYVAVQSPSRAESVGNHPVTHALSAADMVADRDNGGPAEYVSPQAEPVGIRPVAQALSDIEAVPVRGDGRSAAYASPHAEPVGIRPVAQALRGTDAVSSPVDGLPAYSSPHTGPAPETPVLLSGAALLELIRRHTAAILGYSDEAEVGPDDAFIALGANSVAAVELRGRLARELHRSLPAAVVFDHPTPRRLAAYLTAIPDRSPTRTEQPGALEALVRQACRADRGDVAADLIAAASRLRPAFPAATAAEHAPEPLVLGAAQAQPVLGAAQTRPVLGAAQTRPTLGAAPERPELGVVQERPVLASPQERPVPASPLERPVLASPLERPVLASPQVPPVLVCFPSVLPSAGPHEYAALAAEFGDAVTTLAVPEPGFADAGALPADLDALTAAHAAALARHRGTHPLVLCGHSSGGLIAHAVAARLEQLGRPADGVILLDTFWPDEIVQAQLLPRILSRAVVQDLFGAAGIGDERLSAAGGYLRLLAGWTPPPVGTATLLVSAVDPLPGADGIVPTTWRLPHTAAAVAGDHFTMLTGHTEQLAATIRQWLTGVRPQDSEDRP
nr:type I polyketide synthase [Nocardia sp. BMG111209]